MCFQLYVVVALPAAAVAFLLLELYIWHSEFESVATFVSLLVALIGFLVAMIVFDVKFGFDGSLFVTGTTIITCSIFGILFV
jgi:hypothetical protein